LSNGKVLIIGGEDAARLPIATLMLYE